MTPDAPRPEPDHWIDGEDAPDIVPVWQLDSAECLSGGIAAWIEGVEIDGSLSEGPAVDELERDARKVLAAIAWHRRAHAENVEVTR